MRRDIGMIAAFVTVRDAMTAPQDARQSALPLSAGVNLAFDIVGLAGDFDDQIAFADLLGFLFPEAIGFAVAVEPHAETGLDRRQRLQLF